MPWHSIQLVHAILSCMIVSFSQTVVCAIEGPQKTTAKQDRPGDKAIKVILVDHQELKTKVEASKGKIVVVDIWSTSCVPCMREFPHLIELSKKWPGDVICISLNVDYIGLKSKPPESYTANVEAFLNQKKAHITNLQSREPDEDLLQNMKVGSIPAILIFDRASKLHLQLTDANAGDDGLTYQGDVIPAIEKLINKP